MGLAAAAPASARSRGVSLATVFEPCGSASVRGRVVPGRGRVCAPANSSLHRCSSLSERCVLLVAGQRRPRLGALLCWPALPLVCCVHPDCRPWTWALHTTNHVPTTESACWPVGTSTQVLSPDLVHVCTLAHMADALQAGLVPQAWVFLCRAACWARSFGGCAIETHPIERGARAMPHWQRYDPAVTRVSIM